ncbi:MAG: ABC transporter permease [Cytophagales bacterium]|nr:ABC transporter permease [Cytophagales bacterium]
MLHNYLKIAFRSLVKNPVFSFINIAGLSIGMACSMLILLWVWDEVTFDSNFPKSDRLYQVKMNTVVDKGIVTGISMPYPLKEAILIEDTRIKRAAMTNWGEGALLAYGDKKFNKVGMWVSESFLEMFEYPLLAGSRQHALLDPKSIVLTASTAKILFGGEDPLNKMVLIDNRDELKVTGVIADPPANSTFQPAFLISYGYYEITQDWVRRMKEVWEAGAMQLFVELEEGVSHEEVSAGISDLISKNRKDGTDVSLFLHPLTRWHLHGTFLNGNEAGGMITYVRLFVGIATFILVIACINFMNLSTARSERRAREVGIRKSIGSRRKELVIQFLGESVMMSLLAFLTAIMLVELLLPLFNQLVDKKLVIDYSLTAFWAGGLGLTLVTGFLAGSYPALYLSSFRPVDVLKGKVISSRGSIAPRKILVTMQFTFSMLLIITAVVAYQQIEYLRHRDVGYDRENLMLIWTTTDIEKNYAPLKNELLASGSVEGVTKSNSPITAIFSMNNLDDWPGKQPGQRIDFTTIATEYDYAKTMGIPLLQGRDFSPEFPSDSTAMVINQATVEVLNLKNPLGEKVKMWDQEWHIIGVTGNILMDSPHKPVDPMVMVMDPSWSSTISVRMRSTDDLPASIARVEKIFNKHNPAYPFEYRFADASFEKKFTTFNLIGRLSNAFTILAMFITCLGLFGLAAYAVEQRTKEISIRKVMGASVASLIGLITRDFSRLVLIAFFIAAPLGWWLLNSFLERYPYRISVQVWVLPVAGLVTLLLTLVIVSTQAIKSAVANPSDSLRSE